MMAATLLLILATAWVVGCFLGWWITWRKRGGIYDWRIFLGPWTYGRWWHEVNERW